MYKKLAMGPKERLERTLTSEMLWLYLLSLLKGKPRYAYELRSLVKEKFGFLPGNVTSYIVLYKLEGGGFVTARSGERRVYYRITEKGKRELEKGKKFLRALSLKL